MITIKRDNDESEKNKLIVISFAKEKNICELSLSIDNNKAISIYKKLGFKFDELIMFLKLKD